MSFFQLGFISMEKVPMYCICGKNIYKLIKCLDSVSMMIKHIGNLSVECQTCCETSAINMADLMTLLIAKNDTLIIQPNNEIAYKYLP